MNYFTEKGAEDVIKNYTNLIGKKFYFDNSNIKYELKDIRKGIAGCGFDIHFYSYVQGISHASIYNFMLINKIEGYKFEDYDSCSKEI